MSISDVDIITVIKSSQILSEIKKSDQIIENLLPVIAEHSGATCVSRLMKDPKSESINVFALWTEDEFCYKDPDCKPEDCSMPLRLLQGGISKLVEISGETHSAVI